jgi:TPR repeat protein
MHEKNAQNHSLEGVGRAVRQVVGPFGRLAILVTFGLAIWGPLGNAQQAQQVQQALTGPCVASEMAGMLVRDGNAVHVNQFREAIGQTSDDQQNGAKNNGPDDSATWQSLRDARRLFEKQARQGKAAAQVNLAVASLAGWGGKSDAGAALYWLHTAADQKFAPAYYDLGMLYLKGCGVRQDYAEARKYFEAGAKAGDLGSEVNLGYLYDNGLSVAQDRAIAASWYRKAADAGEPKAQYNLADLYLRGEGVIHDEAVAFDWFQKAALQGHSGARVMLGHMLAAGRGTGKDTVSAYMWLAAAASQGDTRGQSLQLSLEKQLTQEQIASALERAESIAKTDKLSAELAALR